MYRLLPTLALLFVATSVQAGHFQLTPQIIAVGVAEHSEQLTLSFLPGSNTVAAETSIRFNLDQFGWVQVLPPLPTAGLQSTCTLVGGVARATLTTQSGGAMPTMYVIPACRFRLRPHSKTPRGNYYVVESGGFELRVDGSTWSTGSSTMRVIVD